MIEGESGKRIVLDDELEGHEKRHPTVVRIPGRVTVEFPDGGIYIFSVRGNTLSLKDTTDSRDERMAEALRLAQNAPGATTKKKKKH